MYNVTVLHTPMMPVKGTTVRIEARYYSDGVLTDPTTQTVKIENPDATQVSATPTKESTGVYYYDHVADQVGYHSYRAEGTGTVPATGEGEFRVRRSAFG